MSYNKEDVISVAESIREKISEIESERAKLEDSATDKANAISEYDRMMAISVLKLKNKAITEFEGNQISNLQANLIPIIAKGLCYKERFSQEFFEGRYKSILSNIDAIKAELNGFQSINRHLDNQ